MTRVLLLVASRFSLPGCRLPPGCCVLCAVCCVACGVWRVLSAGVQACRWPRPRELLHHTSTFKSVEREARREQGSQAAGCSCVLEQARGARRRKEPLASAALCDSAAFNMCLLLLRYK